MNAKNEEYWLKTTTNYQLLKIFCVLKRCRSSLSVEHFCYKTVVEYKTVVVYENLIV